MPKISKKELDKQVRQKLPGLKLSEQRSAGAASDSTSARTTRRTPPSDASIADLETIKEKYRRINAALDSGQDASPALDDSGNGGRNSTASSNGDDDDDSDQMDFVEAENAPAEGVDTGPVRPTRKAIIVHDGEIKGIQG